VRGGTARQEQFRAFQSRGEQLTILCCNLPPFAILEGACWYDGGSLAWCDSIVSLSSEANLITLSMSLDSDLYSCVFHTKCLSQVLNSFPS